MRSVLRTSTAVVLLSLLGGCASYSNVRFQPNPLDVSLTQGEGGAPLGRALVSVRGIREAEAGEGHELFLILRLDNDGAAPLVLLADECELVDASLESLTPARVARRGSSAGDPLTVAPDDTAVFDLVFAFPEGRDPGDYDLGGLNLRWALRAGDTTQRHSSSFERVHSPYYDGYYHHGYGYGYGYYWPGPYYRGFHGGYWCY